MKELEINTADSYRTTSLKSKLEQHYGERISIIGQSSGPGLICSSSLPLGDALQKLQQVQEDSRIDKDYQILQKAAEILQADCKKCKQNKRENLCEISFDAADKLIPDSVFNFASMLLYDKIAKPGENSN